VNQSSDEFVLLLTASQPALYACILSLLPDRTAAQDVLQETNLTLWYKANEFETGTNFMAWASRIARYHVFNHRRKMSRDRLVFDDELFAELSARQSEQIEEAHRYVGPLRKCLQVLSDEHRALLRQRYSPHGSVQQIAEQRKQTIGAVSQQLYRIRESLLNCVSRRLMQEEA